MQAPSHPVCIISDSWPLSAATPTCLIDHSCNTHSVYARVCCSVRAVAVHTEGKKRPAFGWVTSQVRTTVMVDGRCHCTHTNRLDAACKSCASGAPRAIRLLRAVPAFEVVISQATFHSQG
jgi:hypothetical protein